MRKQTQYIMAFALVAALILTTGGIGWALTANPYTSTLNCPVWPYSDQLTATVTTNQNGSFHYLYTLNFAQSTGESLTSFSVGNMQNSAYTDPGSSVAFSMINSQDSVYWHINAPVGSTVSFWYDSIYSYKLVNVTADGGLPATGQTLGMDATTPEPSSLFPVVMGLGGLVWTARRRRN